MNCKDMKRVQMEALEGHRGRKEEGEEFHDTKKRVVKAGFRKHCKHTKLRSPAPTNGIFFVSGEVKGIALF